MTPSVANRPPMLDALVIGGGPAGLTAAIYLTRFHLSVIVVDSGASRAASIPCTRNHAGFPGGVSGAELLERMRRQALEYGASLVGGQVTGLARAQGDFRARSDVLLPPARAVLLATGVTNRKPEMAPDEHAKALSSGRLRYCPVCDGYEATDQNVAVIGSSARAAGEAEFLRSYTARVTLVSDPDSEDLAPEARERLTSLGVRLAAGPATDIRVEGSGIGLDTAEGRLAFDTVYPSLGSIVHSDLAAELGAERSGDACIKVDAKQRTTVPGLYAAGDVVLGLDQISHAMGEAGVAATTLRNDLAEMAPLLR